MSEPLWPQFSPYPQINKAVTLMAYTMGANPYLHAGEIAYDAPMTISDLIAKIRFEFGDQAAASVRIVVH
jgi:hypothetical protein